ncbi:uncharacterized protein [Asterias amurensis]|uniref:uncharacterized protein n=1 Tax=Asterias amurensis TaxID=7602 RepID=UPI003AB4D380
MAASTMSRASSFGHYLLPLTMNKGQINAKQAEYHIEVKTKYLDIKKHRPERHALRNLLGMLHFRLDKFDESLAFFDKILSDGEDPKNLNALANRKYVCDKLYRIPESSDCDKKMSELLPDDYQNEGAESRLRRARSLAEQAFAYSFDVFDESVTTERYRTSVKLYEEAFELAGDSLAQDEREDWMMSKGMACQKIFSEVKFNKALQKEARKWFEEAANIFIRIKDTNNDSLKSESWRHLGELFQGRSMCSVSVSDNLPLYEPEACFEEALNFTPNDPKLLARYANFLKSNDRLDTALVWVNKSIRQDETNYNSLALFLRGQIFLRYFKKQFTQHNTPHQQDGSFLINAQQDLEKLSESHSTPMYLQELAQVYYYMATDCHGKVKTECGGLEYLHKALTMCAKATAFQDGEKRSNVHKIRGLCLRALGEHQHALRSFKRAVECDLSYNWFSGSGKCLISEYASVLKDMTGGKSSCSQTLFADMVYWLHKAAKTYLMNPQWIGSFDVQRHLASNWENFVKYCVDNDNTSELEDIQEASSHPEQRRRTDEESHLPTSMCPPQSVIEEASGTSCFVSTEDQNPHAPIEAAKVTVYQPPQKRRTQTVVGEGSVYREVSEDHKPHANIEGTKATAYKPPHVRRAQSIADEARGATEETSDDYQTQLQVESSTDSLSALDLGGNKTSSKEKQVTLTVNLQTGKTQIVNPTSSTQEWTSKDASKKPIRSAPEKALNHNFQNDFLVLHSSSASEWVIRCLLEELEESNLKGCIKDRDFMVGKTWLANYTDSIANSACVIIVITQDFEHDAWCNSSMLMAIEQKKLLVPVLREGTKLPMFLNTLTHLDATGAVNWELLKRSIEQQIRLGDA